MGIERLAARFALGLVFFLIKTRAVFILHYRRRPLTRSKTILIIEIQNQNQKYTCKTPCNCFGSGWYQAHLGQNFALGVTNWVSFLMLRCRKPFDRLSQKNQGPGSVMKYNNRNCCPLFSVWGMYVCMYLFILHRHKII